MKSITLKDIKKYLTKHMDGYKAHLGYSSPTHVDLKVSEHLVVTLDRQEFSLVEHKSFIKDSSVYIDNNFKIVDIIDERIPSRKGFS